MMLLYYISKWMSIQTAAAPSPIDQYPPLPLCRIPCPLFKFDITIDRWMILSSPAKSTSL